MARPMLNGTAAQQAAAESFLMKCAGHTKPQQSAQDQTALISLLASEGLRWGRASSDTGAEFSNAWDAASGDKNPSYTGHMLGKDRPELQRRHRDS